ncbi:MAG: tryptophan--tRNA ligase [Firmicutes bacterium]|nr:tryptophan--tRNA ligase [Bacillota bacterium]
MKQSTILSGMRPTGPLHLGHLSVLENWARLQEKHRCFFMVADWHALTTAFDEPGQIVENTRAMVLDWLMVGLDPQKSTIFVQSHVKEHAELHLLFSLITPVSWLERCPTYKDQVQQFREQGKDITTYGFLGYPLLQAADILIYKADLVPVGEDQLPHLELCREVARRFNYLYKRTIFPEPQAYLAEVALIPGIDGRKMSKSYGNEVPLAATPEEIEKKVRMMVTDPARIHARDPGHPEVCTIYALHRLFNQAQVEELEQVCRRGEIGCVPCKKKLSQMMIEFLSPYWERRRELEKDPDYVWDVLRQGGEQARLRARQTMEEIRAAMGFELPRQARGL